MTAPDEDLEPDVITLQEAQERVLAAIETAAERGAGSSEDHERWRTRLFQHQSLLELSNWLLGIKPLDAQFCRFPDCFDPPRPPNKPGHKPLAYCDARRLDGKFAHDSSSAQNRRKKLENRAAAAPDPSGIGAPALAQGGARPVQLARATIRELVEQVLAGQLTLGHKTAEIVKALAAAGDLEQRDIEIDAVRHDAQLAIDEANGRVLQMRTEVREAGEKVEAIQAQIAQADEAAQAARDVAKNAAAAAEAARADRQGAVNAMNAAELKARRDVATAWRLAAVLAILAERTARWLIAETRHHAEQQVTIASEAFDAELASRTDAMDAAVAEANRALEEVQAEAARQEADLQRREAAAEQSVRDATTALEETKAQLNALRADNTALHTAAVQREEAHRQAMQGRDDEHRAAMDRLHADHRREADELRRQLDEAREQHRAELDRVRAEARADYDRQLAENQALIERAYRPLIEELRQTNQRLTDAAHRTDADADAGDVGEQSPPRS